MRSYSFDFSSGSTFDLSLATNYLEHTTPMLESDPSNSYSSGINIENTMVIWNYGRDEFLVIDRANCYQANDDSVPARCIGCSGPAENQCTECIEPGYSIDPGQTTPSPFYTGVESGRCQDLSCMAGTPTNCIQCTAPNTCTACDPASSTPILDAGNCVSCPPALTNC